MVADRQSSTDLAAALFSIASRDFHQIVIWAWCAVLSRSRLTPMKRDCPTIQELLAFDTVMRLRSVSRAADALCVSASAVSKQLTSLEAFVRQPLLYRGSRDLRPTPAGTRYWERIADSLRRIETASSDLRAGASTRQNAVFTLACVPTFLTQWLLPRINDFRASHPEVTFRFGPHLAPHENLSGDIDAAIRYGAGGWPGIAADYLAGRDFVAVAAPRRSLTHAPFADQTLLHHEEAPTAWRQWAQARHRQDLKVDSGPRFAQYSAIIQAACNDLGVGLVPRILADEELGRGRLVMLGAPIVIDQAHYLCYHANRLHDPVFQSFRQWLLDSVQATVATTPG